MICFYFVVLFYFFLLGQLLTMCLRLTLRARDPSASVLKLQVATVCLLLRAVHGTVFLSVA